ncbi:MAG: hypothetical protein ACRD8Z_05555 [Nitrososphaeraceae archaeon]
MTEMFKIAVPCYACEQRGKRVFAGTFVSDVDIPYEAFIEFLAKYSDAIFICDKCSEEIDAGTLNIIKRNEK